jgi:DNA mismatch repair protein MutS
MESPIIDEYVAMYDEKRGEYGANTVLFMMVGSFYEMYGYPRDNRSGEYIGQNMPELSQILGIICTKKNKGIEEISRKNPQMCGFPVSQLDKYVELLVNRGYTVVIADQYQGDTGTKKMRREVREIVSPSTYIAGNRNDSNSNNLIAIRLYSYRNRHKMCDRIAYALSVIDLSIGTVYLYEYTNAEDDNALTFIDLYQQILKYSPSEVLVLANNTATIDFHKIIAENAYIFANTKLYQCINDEKLADLCSVEYQNATLAKAYDAGNTTPIEALDLEHYPDLVIALTALINFAYKHNDKIVNYLHKPKMVYNTDSMILGYNLIRKLNIVKTEDHANKYGSLLCMLNNAVTAMGRRYFADRLLNPLTDPSKINAEYDNIAAMLNRSIYQRYRDQLKEINDIEKLFRLLALNKITPDDYYKIYKSLMVIIRIIRELSENNAELADDIAKITGYIESRFDEASLESGKIELKSGIYAELDALYAKMTESSSYFEIVAATLNRYDREANEKQFFKVEDSENRGKYITVTAARYENIKRKIEKSGSDILITYNGGEYKFADIIANKISQGSGTMRLYPPYSQSINDDIGAIRDKITATLSQKYSEINAEIFAKYRAIIRRTIRYVKQVDYYSTNAYNAHRYKYSRPSAINGDNSAFDITGLRHPIIEMVNNSEAYTPNNVALGGSSQMTGMLLYGVNSVGKSSLMKSIGISLIMAQAGMYVAADTMTYTPYHRIYTRLPSGDDLFTGKSTFVSEIVELRNILRASNNRTLVIGDELCAGTETISATAIVAAGIKELSAKGSTYIFATHLHELSDIQDIREIKELGIYHMTAARQLAEGDGDKLYGLEICKTLGLSDEFMRTANKIRRELMGIPDDLVSNKRSNYNRSVIMDLCRLCKKNKATETHHIRYQRDADERGFIGHYHKNRAYNLLPICEECHDNLHQSD